MCVLSLPDRSSSVPFPPGLFVIQHEQVALARICGAAIRHTCWIKKRPRRKWFRGGHVRRQQNIHVGSKTSPEEVVPARICRAATKHTCWIKNKPGGSVTGEDITYMLDQKQARGLTRGQRTAPGRVNAGVLGPGLPARCKLRSKRRTVNLEILLGECG